MLAQILISASDNSIINLSRINDVVMNIDEIIGCHSALTNGTAGLLISLGTCRVTAVPIKIGSISWDFPDCLFGEDGGGGGNSLVRDLCLCG